MQTTNQKPIKQHTEIELLQPIKIVLYVHTYKKHEKNEKIKDVI